MGTPMAPNFANLFMTKFESEMLSTYEQEHNKQTLQWLRLIGDVFFMWTHIEKSLKHFIDFCNDYASSTNMKSSISFTSEYSNSSVSLLDMKVRIENGHICTSVYSKPVDTHTSCTQPPFTHPLQLFSYQRHSSFVSGDFAPVLQITSTMPPNSLSSSHSVVSKEINLFNRQMK